VNVTVDAKGQPTFEIVKNVAWDAIEETPEAQALVARAEAVCFGTLAQRSARSRATIQGLLSHARSARLKVCDINFRQRFYTREIVEASLRAANLLKLNEDELPVLLKLVEIRANGAASRSDVLGLMKKFDLDLVCVTLGERGAILHTRPAEIHSPGYRVKVADTVGSGDAFTAGFVVKLLSGAPLEEALHFANRVGAYVASKPGATPPLDAKMMSAFAARPMDRKAAFLNEIKRLTLQASADPDTFFRAFFERVGGIIEAQGGSMWFHEKASDKLHCRVDSKPKEFATQTPEQEVIEKAVLNAIKSGNSILVAPDQGDSALAKASGKESGNNVLSAMCVPYEIDQESSGALFFFTDGQQRRFDTTDVYLVKQLATYVRAYCLNRKRTG
jgi:fructokinase